MSMLCFPNGVVPRAVLRRTESLTEVCKYKGSPLKTSCMSLHQNCLDVILKQLQEHMFTPLSDLETAEKSFVFLVNKEENILYGVCVWHKEIYRV